MNGQQMIQQANDYVLLCDGPKVALTMRSRAHLDDSFWQQFVRDRRLFFWDTDIMLNNLASGLRWFDVTQVATAHRHGNLLIRREAGVFVFDVMQNGVASTVAMCEWKDGRLCPVPIYSSLKCDVILWEHLIDHWNDVYRQAVYDVYGLYAHSWAYHTLLLVYELFDAGKYDYAHETLKSAIARAKMEGDDELVAKFEHLEQQLLAK
jgi:hypothetical protein